MKNLLHPSQLICLRLFFSILFITVFGLVHSQEIGTPLITNYHYLDYGASPINWWVEEDDSGIIYFANNDGLLQYDGSAWTIVKGTDQFSECRSLVYGQDGIMYAGFVGDFGYIESNSKNELEFISLLDKVPEENRDFQEVWEIDQDDDGTIYFRSSNYLFIWKEGQMKVLYEENGFHVGAFVNGKLYNRIWNIGLCIFKDDSFHLVPGGEIFADERVYLFTKYDNDRLLLGSRAGQLYIFDGDNITPWKTEADPYLKDKTLYGGLTLPDGRFVLNSFNDGVVILDRDGKLHQVLDKDHGLQDNSATRVFLDSKGILWIALFNGISKIHINSNFTYFGEESGLPSKSVYSAIRHEGTLYLGSNNGLYHYDNSKSKFELIPSTIGQTQDYLKIGKDLIISSNGNGVYKVVDKKMVGVRLDNNYDYRSSVLYPSKVYPGRIYVVLFTGISVLKYSIDENGSTSWKEESFTGDFFPDFWGIQEQEDGKLWLSSSNNGEFYLCTPKYENDVLSIENMEKKLFNTSHGLPDLPLGVLKFGEQIYFGNFGQWMGVYNSSTDRFEKTDPPFQKYIKKSSINAAPWEDSKGNIWFNFGTGPVVSIKNEDGTRTFYTDEFNQIKNFPIWGIFPEENESQNVWFTGSEGLFKYEGEFGKIETKAFSTLIRSVELAGDSLIYGGVGVAAKKLSIPTSIKSIKFNYSAPFFQGEENTTYSTKLEGYDEDWTLWNKNHEREYLNLSSGEYVFKVKSLNAMGQEGQEASYSFFIKPPWFSTWWAYLLYILAAAGLVYLLIKWRTKALEENRIKLEKEVKQRTSEMQQRVEELAVINSVQEGLVEQMDMQNIYQLVGTKIQSIFNAQSVLITSFDHDKSLEKIQYNFEEGILHENLTRPIDPFRKHIIDNKKPIIINDDFIKNVALYGFENPTPVPGTKLPKSGAWMPMIVGEVVKGYVSLQNVDQEFAYSQNDINLLETLTNSMSVALENARLFEESNRLLQETAQQAAEMSTVNQIGQAMASRLELDALITMVGDNMRDLFNADIVYIALLDGKTNTINFPYGHGDDYPPIQLGQGLTSQIILSKESKLINQNIDGTYEKLGIENIGAEAESYLGVPIPLGDEAIGVISVQSTERVNRFDESDLHLLETIASNVGIALHNAQLYKDAQKAKALAEDANEAKSAFLSTVSHELRTPLTSVLGFAKIIKRRLEDKIFPAVVTDDPKVEKSILQVSKNLDVVVSEGERLTSLVNDVLDLAKIEAGKVEWHMDTMDISEAIDRAIMATSALFSQRNLKHNHTIEKDLPKVDGDKDKLIQVVINLLSNAVKFTDEGVVETSAYLNGDNIVVSIKDTGIGIAPEDEYKVFEKFRQVGDTLTDKPQGTGLGLPICKEIVEQHGGTMWLKSKVGEGSTFFFSIPIIQTDSPQSNTIKLDALVSKLKNQISVATNGEDRTILVVDDESPIRSLLNQELTEQGYNVLEAGNGREALEVVRNNKPDLILLDVMMPEMNGYDVAAVLKNDPSTMDIPIIILSILKDKTRGYKIGVDRYLTKPIDTNKLFSEISNLIGQGSSHKRVLIVDEDISAMKILTDVLQTSGYQVVEANGKELVQKAISSKPDIIILNSLLDGHEEAVKTLRFEKGMEEVLFLVYQ